VHCKIYTLSHAHTVRRSTYTANRSCSKQARLDPLSPCRSTRLPYPQVPLCRKVMGSCSRATRIRHCSRKLTHDTGKTLFIVVDAKKRQLGLRVPNFVLHQVHRQAKETLPARRAAVEKRNAASIDAAAAKLEDLFPKMPETKSTSPQAWVQEALGACWQDWHNTVTTQGFAGSDRTRTTSAYEVR